MPPKRSSTSEASTMPQAAIRKLVADSVAASLETKQQQWQKLTIPLEKSLAFVCNDAMNVSCNPKMYDLLDDNNFFIFDDVNVRISPVSKMPFRKKPRDSMHIIDSGCSKHMTGNRALLTIFVEKFLETVRFGNNDFAVIAGYGDMVIGSMTIKKVYYVEGLGHNLFNIMKSSTTNVETSINDEVFHEISESFQGESSSSSLNDDVQHSPEEVILPQTNTQSIPINMIPNGDEASTLHNVFNERLEDAYFDAREVFQEVSESFQKESSSSSLNDDVQKSPEEVIISQTKTQSISNDMIPNVDETTFLNEILKEEMYVGQPPGFVSKQYPDHVYALDKALFGMENYDTVPTPMVEQAKIKLDLVGKQVDHTDYRSMIGSLMYVTSSRPNIMFTTCMYARNQANPNEHHVLAVKRIFRYLKGTINLGLWYPKDSGFDLTAYSDADHAGCHLDRKIAEYVAVSGCCTQVLWMHTKLIDYGFFYDKVPIYCDSKSAIAISCNPGVTRVSKRRKLNPRYIRPFKILTKVGTLAYRLELPEKLSRVHSTFHVSNLKKCFIDEPLAIPLDEIQIDDKLNFIEEPVEIMDREVKRLKQSHIPIVKVHWNSRRGPELLGSTRTK
nr:hypothetical protein [Tanacetum cinerariifolium]